MTAVYLAGIGITPFGKSAKTLVELMTEAAVRALSSSKISEVEAVYIGVMNPEEFTGESNVASQVTDALGMTGLPALRVETASSAGAAALHTGFQAIASGCYRRLLVIGGEKMTHLTTSATTRILAEVIDRQERQCGATMPALAAMITERYRRKYRLSHGRLERILCRIAMKNHLNGSKNPHAQFQKPISKEQYLSSKLVATPLRLFDCSPITDGAAAVVLTSEPTDLMISGIGQGTGPLSLRNRETFSSFPATQIAAQRAYDMAGISPEQIDFAEVHDAFTPFEIISTEDVGFFRPGKGGDAAEDGTTSREGKLPINLSGGLKARGHPIGASGVAQVFEAVQVFRREAGVMPKREPKRALAQSTGGLGTNNFVTIIERSDNSRTTRKARLTAARSRAAPTVKEPLAGPDQDEGRIETFTVLYSTPDGFLPPLALALIRTRRGLLRMAQGEDVHHLKIGRDVYIRKVADSYFFTVKSHLRTVQEAMKKLFRRGASPLSKKDVANRKESP